MHKFIVTTALASALAALSVGAGAVTDADTGKAAADAGISRRDAKDLKTHSEAEYKARKKVAEANETLDKADCKTALDGSAKRACDKAAKAAAKSNKADAKLVHESQEKAIKEAK